VILVDRSRLETHWRCARRRYWNYDFDNTGIAPVDYAWPLTFGIICHSQAAKLMRVAETAFDVDTRMIVDETVKLTLEAGLKLPKLMTPQRAKEWGVLAGGLMAGTAQYFIPKLLEEFDIELIEGELYYDIEGNPLVRIMVSPDLVLRHKHTGLLHYHEYKTTGARDTVKWCNSWEYQPQLHIGCRAIERHFNEPCTYAIVQGWKKAYESYGRLNSNLLWGYRGPKGQIQRKYQYGWERFLVDDPWKWLQTFSEEEWSAHFPRTLPIGVNDQLVNSFCQQVAWRERYILSQFKGTGGKTGIDLSTFLDRNYPQSFNQCEPSFGERCPFLEACHVPAVNADPPWQLLLHSTNASS